MKYVKFDDGVETEQDDSDIVQIMESSIVEGEVVLICRTSDESCFKVKLSVEETLDLGKTFFIQAAKSLPEGMQDNFIKQLIGGK